MHKFFNRCCKKQERYFRFLILFIFFMGNFLGRAPGLVEARSLNAPTPTVTLDVPAEAFIGDSLSVTVAFNNPGDATGYGPFIDLFVPKSGMDGVISAPDDGITYDEGSAKYLASTLNDDVLDCPSGTSVVHPLTGESITCPAVPAGYPAGFVWQLAVIELPFGSFTVGQPAAEISLSLQMSNLADLSTPLPIQARGGFRYGDSATGTSPIYSAVNVVKTVSPTLLTLTKTYNGPEAETATGPNYLRQYTITVDIAEGQTLTDFAITDYLPDDLQFTRLISASPSSYTETDLPVTGAAQIAPDNDLIVSWASVTGGAGTADVTATFEFFVPEFRADDGDSDTPLEPVLDPLTGACKISINDARAEGLWVPIDTRDEDSNVVSDVTPDDFSLEICAVTIQKSLSFAPGGDIGNPGYTPDDILEYTYAFQVSDYFTVGGSGGGTTANTIQIVDVLSDGQLFKFDAYTADAEASFNVSDRGGASSGYFNDGENLTVDTSQNPAYTTGGVCGSGETTLTFDISEQLADINTNHSDAVLTGGCVGDTYCTDSANPFMDLAAAAVGSVSYQAEIQDNYSCAVPSGDQSVDQDDRIENAVDIRADVLDNDLLNRTGVLTAGEDSSASAMIVDGDLTKSIYARNGVVGSTDLVAPGDTITYRLQYTLPTSDIENFSIYDYLPLPVLIADDPNADGVGGDSWVWDSPAACPAIPTSTPPESGHFALGPSDSFHCVPGPSEPATPPNPTLSYDTTANSLHFDYGDYDNQAHLASQVDILFTITITSEPFIDGLYLTNQARITYQNSFNEPDQQDQIIQFQLTQPLFEKITKGVVAAHQGTFSPTTVAPAGVSFTTPPALAGDPPTYTPPACPRFSGTINSAGISTTPINSNLSGADAEDVVTYAIVLENVGTGLNGAFDTAVRDSLPAGATYVPNSLCVANGAGTSLAVNAVSTTSPLTETALTDGSELFGSGIVLIDPGDLEGALSAYSATSGENIAIITYDVILDSTVAPRAELDNTATLFNYAGRNGGTDHSEEDLTDDAAVTVKDPQAAKTLTGTEFVGTNNSAAQAVIGETVDYQVTITVPEGITSGLNVVDTLDTGLGFVSCLGISASSDLTTSLGSFDAACAPNSASPTTGNPKIETGARKITFNLGDVTNANVDNSTPETITIRYRAIVLNISGNQSGITRKNSAVVSWTGGTLTRVRASVSIVEPALKVTKSVVVGTGGTSGDAGDPVEYTIVLSHNSGPNAYDATFSDLLPYAGGTPLIVGDFGSPPSPPSFTVTDSTGVLTNSDFEIVGSYAAGWTLQTKDRGTAAPFTFDFAAGTGRTVTLKINGFINYSTQVGAAISNTAKLDWTSLDGNPGEKSAYISTSVERTGVDGTGGLNDYVTSATADVSISIPDAGKTITGTNQVFTKPDRAPDEDPADAYDLPVKVAVGETIRYQVVFTMPEGSATNATITDILDPGLAFVSCESVTADSAITPQAVFTCDNVVFEDYPNSTDPQNLSRKLSLPMGNLVNNASDADPEQIILNYTVVVLNSSAVNNGVNLNNRAVAKWGDTQEQAVEGPQAQVVEPVLEVQKSALINSGTRGDAGDTAEYTVVLRHAAGSTTDAFNVELSDPLPVLGGTPPAASLLISPTLTVVDSEGLLDDSGAVGYPFFTLTGNNSDGWSIQTTGSGFDFPYSADRTISLTISGTLAASVNPDQVVQNTADIQWSSLPGDVTTAQTGNNTLSCERTGDSGTGVCGAAYNDLSDDDDADITIYSPAISKALNGTSASHTDGSDVTIGETVTYDLKVTLPEGTSNNVQIVDRLPDGMAYVGGTAQLITTTADSTLLAEDFSGTVNGFVSPAADGTNGSDVTINLTSVSVPGDASTDNNSFVIRLTALVLDVAGNQGVGTQTQLDNSAALQVNGGTSYTTDTVTATVVEPQMAIVKEFDTADSVSALPAPIDDDQAAKNDTVIITLKVTNNGTSDAYDVVIEDPLPNTRFGSIAEGVTPSDFSFSVVASGTDSVVRYTGGPIPVGETRNFSFQATLLDIAVDEVYTNTAEVVQATTLDGTDGNERDEPNVDDDDTLEGVVPDLTLSKDDGTLNAAPGSILTYQIRIENVGGRDASGVVISETVPANTVYSGSGWTCDPISGAAGASCTYTIGNLASGANITIPFVVTVNNPLAASVEQIYNAASVDDDHSHGDDPTPLDNSDDDTDTVVGAAPDLIILKDDGATTTIPNGIVIYTLQYANKGTQDATGVIITETVPAHTTFDQTNSTVGWDCADDAPSGTVCKFTVGALAAIIPPNPVTYQSIFFAVQVDGPNLPAGVDQVENSVSIADDGSNGVDLTPSDNTSEDDTPINAAPDLNILKSDGDATTLAGGTVIYTLTYNNAGNQDATGVVITETVPANTVFNPTSSDAGWSCAGSGTAGDVCTLTIGDLAADAGGTANFAVTVDTPLPALVTQISNTAVIADDGSNGPDPTDDNSSSDTTPLVDAATVPDLTLQKDDGGISTAPGQTISYTLTYSNIGSQAATNVVISETVPLYTTFDAGSSTSGWSCADGSPAGTICSINVGSVAGGGAGGTVTFAVIVDSSLPSGITQIDNAASVGDDGTNGTDADLTNNDAADDTPTDAAPDLSITKTDGIMQVAAGERLTYTLTVTNLGDQDATGVVVSDLIPEHTTYVSSTPEGTFDEVEGKVTWPSFNLAVGDSSTFTLVVDVDSSLEPDVTAILNTASVVDDGSNGEDLNSDDNTAEDEDAVRPGTKRLTDSENHPYNVLPEVSVGEIVTYEVDLTVAKGATLENLVLTDTLDQGLAFVDADASILIPAALTAAPDDFAAVLGNPVISAVGAEPTGAGRQIQFDFGTVVNSDPANDITLTVRYRAVVLNADAVISGSELNNSAVWTWDGGIIDNTAPVVVAVEPQLSLCKKANTSVAKPGDVITFTLTVSPMTDMETEAFDVVLEDTVPGRMRYIPGSLVLVSGPTPDLLDDTAAPLLRIGWNEVLPTSEPAVLTFQARILYLNEGEEITNKAFLEWSSLPGDFSDPQTTSNTLSTERVYDPPEPVCVTGGTSTATISYPETEELPSTGFIPNQVTAVGPQPNEKQYQDLGELWLEIPKLNLKTPIVGVPQSEDGWDLTWLENKIGYLDGTAFPSWAGNSGLTAHVYDANGKPGPFIHLNTLAWGDQVIIHYQGQRSVFEVREVSVVSPKDLSVLHHEEYPWVTLITCQGYDAAHQNYTSRVVVRAVQISVGSE